MDQPIKVLIVDDHAVVRRGVRAFLETQPDIAVVGEAASGKEALRLVADHIPDVAIVDLLLPEKETGDFYRSYRAGAGGVASHRRGTFQRRNC